METLSFTLGVLSVIIVAFVTVLVWGIVKVVKQQKQITSLNQMIDESIQNMWRTRDQDHSSQYEKERNMDRELSRRFEELEREITLRFNNTDMRVISTETEIYRQINDQITDAVTQSKSYTDSRIDKLIDAYFEHNELNKKKQVLKG